MKQQLALEFCEVKLQTQHIIISICHQLFLVVVIIYMFRMAVLSV